MNGALASLRRLGVLSDLDVHLARMMGRLAGTGRAQVELAAALVSRARRDGHSCVSLARHAGRPFPGMPDTGGDQAAPCFPDFETLRAALIESGVVAVDGRGSIERRPLVLDSASRLYLGRLRDAEERVARGLQARLFRRRPPLSQLLPAQTVYRELFGEPEAGPGPSLQAVAAVTALQSGLTVITGGPGTGKTTSIARLVALLRACEPELRVDFAAPTGKAAARLGEALRAMAKGRQQAPGTVAAKETLEACTIHRLLGYSPRRESFRYSRATPLPCDVLVVDEASMIDLTLMDALLDALSPEARLILVGDASQLTSVDAGSVLADVCAAADGPAQGLPSEVLSTCAALLTGEQLEPAWGQPGGAIALGDAVITLERSYRFDEQEGISRLAAALRRGEAAEAIAVLEDPAFSDARWIPSTPSAAELVELVGPALSPFLQSRTPEEARRRLGGAQVLCALREGPEGVSGVNEIIAGSSLLHGASRARPIMVTRNDYGLGLWNGDLGVLWDDEDERVAFFDDSRAEKGEPRRLTGSQLPDHRLAFATTVHKSQGSELDEVLLLLPSRSLPLLTRELVYTAVTRARERVTVIGPREVFVDAMKRRVVRGSGLSGRLSSE